MSNSFFVSSYAVSGELTITYACSKHQTLKVKTHCCLFFFICCNFHVFLLPYAIHIDFFVLWFSIINLFLKCRCKRYLKLKKEKKKKNEARKKKSNIIAAAAFTFWKWTRGGQGIQWKGQVVFKWWKILMGYFAC